MITKMAAKVWWHLWRQAFLEYFTLRGFGSPEKDRGFCVVVVGGDHLLLFGCFSSTFSPWFWCWDIQAWFQLDFSLCRVLFLMGLVLHSSWMDLSMDCFVQSVSANAILPHQGCLGYSLFKFHQAGLVDQVFFTKSL